MRASGFGRQVQRYIGFRSIWQRIAEELDEDLLQRLEFLVGPRLIEDAIDHYNEARALAEILVAKVNAVNRLLVNAEHTEMILFDGISPSLVQGCADDLLRSDRLQNYIRYSNKMNDFLETETIEKFKQSQGQPEPPDRLPPETQHLEADLTPEFVDKVRQLLKLEHKELDERIAYLQRNIYNNHKIERIARQVYNEFKEAQEQVDMDELKRFEEFLNSKNIEESTKSDDLLLEQLGHSSDTTGATDAEEDRLCQTLRAHRPRTKRIDYEGRPVSSTLSQSMLRAPPRPLTGLPRKSDE